MTKPFEDKSVAGGKNDEGLKLNVGEADLEIALGEVYKDELKTLKVGEVPFICEAIGYRFAVPNTGLNSGFSKLNLVTGSITTIKGDIGVVINAVGYNAIDNLIYGIVQDEDKVTLLVSVDKNGDVIKQGIINNIPIEASTAMGAINSNGHLFIRNNLSDIYYVVDTNQNSVNFCRLLDPINKFALDTTPFGTEMTGSSFFSDWTFGVNGVMLFGANNTGTVVRVNSLTGTYSEFITGSLPAQSYGSAYSGQDGFIYLTGNNDGIVYRISINGNQAIAEVFAKERSSLGDDGTSCLDSFLNVDFGDAPDISGENGTGNYNTLLVNNGPRHQIRNELFIGTSITLESATGDEGISEPINIEPGCGTYRLPLTVINNTGMNANLYAWIDWNKDGVFQSNESITKIVRSSSGSQIVDLNFIVPKTFIVGDKTFLRVRLTTDNLTNLGDINEEDTRSIGPASDGEVEDYIVRAEEKKMDLELIKVVSKLVDKVEAKVGDEITYTLGFANIGSNDAVDIIIDDKISEGASYIQGTIVSNVLITGNPIENIKLVNPVIAGQYVMISFKVKVDEVPIQNIITNMANINYKYKANENGNEFEKSIRSNEVYTSVLDIVELNLYEEEVAKNISLTELNDTYEINSLTLENKEAKIVEAIKTVDKDFVDVGDVIAYNITFKNDGEVLASDVLIIDPIPVGTSYMQGSLISNVGVTGSPTTIISLINPVLPGQAVSISFRVKVDEIPTINPILNKATINYKYIDSQEYLVADSMETNIVMTEVRHGEIPIVGANAAIKIGDKSTTTIGENITYTVRSKNTGNTQINNVIIKDILPLGTSFISGSTTVNNVPTAQNPIIGVNIGTLQAGEECIVKFKVVVLKNAPDEIKNSATILYEYTVDPNLPPKKESIITNDVIIDNLTPEIIIIKSANKEAVILNEIIKYSLEVENVGEVAALDLIIKDTLAIGLEYINNLSINGVPFIGDITLGINIPSLTPNEKIVISFETKVIKIGSGDYVFQNQAKGTYNYQVEAGGTVFSGITESNLVKILAYETPVSIVKNTAKELVKLGDIFAYTVKIKNDGELDAENVLIKDKFPLELDVKEVRIDGTSIIGDIEDGIFIGPLDKGEELIVTIIVKAIGQLSNPFKNIIDATLLFRPDTNRAIVEVHISGEDKGIIGRDQSNIYHGVVVVKPNLNIIKKADKIENAIGDMVKYTLVVKNTGNVNVQEITIRDIINEKLNFIAGSVMIDGVLAPMQDVLSGIVIESISVGEQVNITFDVKILKAGRIPNQAIAEYIYKSETNGINQAGVNESNVEIINASNVDLIVNKVANKEFAVLRDEIKYTVTISNTTKIITNNIIVKDNIPRYVEVISGSFYLNGQAVNTVNLANGINLGILQPGQVAVIEYSVRVISNSCNNVIQNGVEVKYSYILPNGLLGKKLLPAIGAQVNDIQMGMCNFKQLNIESYLTVPDAKPEIQTINIIKGNIEIKSSHVIKTAPNISNEGQYLTGYKLVVSGCLNLIVEYTGLNALQAVHSTHYSIPFSTFVILPEDYIIGSKFDVQGILEDIYHKQVDAREFFTNVTTLINVKILFY
ncbi:GEVED domain-containing protein [uncultured Clostridium sp.]|jgi:uncharacterized repeat protein (TIGR01451 family)|uniref:DUF7507 domain-containing protein n=1 Tax=uncultured Clostridium sp. TaxID=59620 RepID=UPI0026369786|nr:GEVED domain-containing protein [uncultured Clostridium sp.]